MDAVGGLVSVETESVFDHIAFLCYFNDLRDPRQGGKVVYPLREVLILCLLAILAGAETFVDIALFGQAKLDLLRRFAKFDNGAPPHDRLGEIFAALDTEQFQRCFAAWTARLLGVPEGVVAIDGKTLRRSAAKSKGQAAIHVVSAFAAHHRLVLGQVKTETKSNEITAIPKLLDMLALEGSIITIDAMGCQRDIAAKILAKGANYILALKGNQGALNDDSRLFAQEQKANNFKDAVISRHETVDGDHGRIETRRVTVFTNVEWLRRRHDWPGLRSLIMVESTREFDGKTQSETRYYIASFEPPAKQAAVAVRSHWSIENSLHWQLDVHFRDDDCRVRKDNAPANFLVMRHAAYNLIRRGPGKNSFRAKRKLTAWDDGYLLSLVTA